MRVKSAAALAVLLIAGCLTAAQAQVQVSDGWSRETVTGTTVGVGYMTLINVGAGERKLLKITTPLADSVQLHQSSIDAQGVAHMWPMASLELKAGETVRFTPNGRHLMLVGLKEPLRVGMDVPVTMIFDRSDPPVTVHLIVRALTDVAAPLQAEHTHH